MIFTRTKRAAQKPVDELGDRGFNVGGVHGDMGQSSASARWPRSYGARVPVATDVAARGIDVGRHARDQPATIPDDRRRPSHRAGRTGARARPASRSRSSTGRTCTWALINRALEFGQPGARRDLLVEPAPVRGPRHP
ncbi:helicase-related protein [Microbacterium sp.]|uniref:helicase-related protein n=1 Tax=Microbacterium sp. TaxID=51671 RepID=UPI003A8CC495